MLFALLMLVSGVWINDQYCVVLQPQIVEDIPPYINEWGELVTGAQRVIQDAVIGDCVVQIGEETVTDPDLGTYVIPVWQFQNIVWAGNPFCIEAGFMPTATTGHDQDGNPIDPRTVGACLPRNSVVATAPNAPMSLTVNGAAGNSNLVAYWSFDEGSGTIAADGSINAHAGTLVNNAGWTLGKKSSGVSLSSNDSYVMIGDFPIYDFVNTIFTAAGWIKANAIDYGYMFAKRDDTGTTGISGGWMVRMNAGSGTLTARTLGINGAVSERTTLGSYADGTWHHFAVIFNTSINDISVYIDGSLNQGALFSTAEAYVPAVGLPLVIGAAANLSSDSTFLGQLDELRLYDRALSEADIGALR